MTYKIEAPGMELEEFIRKNGQEIYDALPKKWTKKFGDKYYVHVKAKPAK